jgi:DtxR family Mn-dependent transcriptional regulator
MVRVNRDRLRERNRMMDSSRSKEMYLETIYILENSHDHAHVADIAERLGITKPSVTKAMNRLKEEGLINKETYGHITLTEKGEALAQEVYHKHCTISRFLEKSLGLSPDEAATNACRMEHVITDKMMRAIEAYLEKEAAGRETENKGT